MSCCWITLVFSFFHSWCIYGCCCCAILSLTMDLTRLSSTTYLYDNKSNQINQMNKLYIVFLLCFVQLILCIIRKEQITGSPRKAPEPKCGPLCWLWWCPIDTPSKQTLTAKLRTWWLSGGCCDPKEHFHRNYSSI
jgi:hypothetical protein